MDYTETTVFLTGVFDIAPNVALQLRHKKNFIHYGLWKEITEEQFNELYSLAQEGKYGDFFYLAEKMNLKRKYKKLNARHLRKMKENPEYRERQLRKRREKYRERRNKNAMDREIQTE